MGCDSCTQDTARSGEEGTEGRTHLRPLKGGVGAYQLIGAENSAALGLITTSIEGSGSSPCIPVQTCRMRYLWV